MLREHCTRAEFQKRLSCPCCNIRECVIIWATDQPERGHYESDSMAVKIGAGDYDPATDPAVWLAKWFVVFLHHCSAWIFYLLGSVLLATAILSYLMQQSQGVEALQMLIGGFVIFMIPQVVGSVVVLLELAAVMLRQVWYI